MSAYGTEYKCVAETFFILSYLSRVLTKNGKTIIINYYLNFEV